MKDDVARKSFEKVKENQEKLRKKIDKLIKEERPIKDEEERTEFLDMLEWACLGHDGNEPYEVEVNGSIYKIGSVGLFIRYLLYQDKEEIKLPDFPEAPQAVSGVSKKIGPIWKTIRYELFSVFPTALQDSFSKSPETPKDRFRDVGGEVE